MRFTPVYDAHNRLRVRCGDYAFTKEQAWDQFGFLLGAFQYGTPPHGGFAFGVDRLVMILTGSENLREVVAFPKAQNANCLMMQTPSDVQEEQLKMLHIRVADDEQE